MTDEELMRSLREVTGSRFDPQTRRLIKDVERDGARVTVFEVRGTDGMLVIAHTSPRPSITAIRTAYDRWNSQRAERAS